MRVSTYDARGSLANGAGGRLTHGVRESKSACDRACVGFPSAVRTQRASLVTAIVSCVMLGFTRMYLQCIRARSVAGMCQYDLTISIE